MKQYFKTIYYVLYIFVFIFAPPFLKKVNIVHILSVYSLFILIKYYRIETSEILKIKELSNFYKKMLLFIFYLLFISLLSAIFDPVSYFNYIVNFYRMFLILGPMAICVVYLSVSFKRNKVSFWDGVRLVILSGCIQLCFSIVMLLFPSVKYTIVDFILMNTTGIGVEGIPPWEYNRRYFAFSDNMVDMLGYGVGLIASLPLFLGIKKGNTYFLLSPILFVIPMLNAVTGVVIYLIGLIFTIPLIIMKYRYKLIKYILPLLLVVSLGFFLINNYSPYSLQWVTREISTLFLLNENASNQVTSIGNLFREKSFKLPDGLLQLWWGTGHTVYNVPGYEHSDVGYTNNIWLVGILGSIFLYSNFIRLFLDAYNVHTDRIGKMLILFIALSLLIFEVKGGGLTYQPAMAITSLLTVWSFTLEFDKPNMH